MILERKMMNLFDNLLLYNLEDNWYLLFYEYMYIEVRNGYFDILFYWYLEFEILYVYEGIVCYYIDYDFFNS